MGNPNLKLGGWPSLGYRNMKFMNITFISSCVEAWEKMTQGFE